MKHWSCWTFHTKSLYFIVAVLNKRGTYKMISKMSVQKFSATSLKLFKMKCFKTKMLVMKIYYIMSISIS